MAWLLVIVGGAAALLYVLTALLNTVRGHEKIGFWGLLLTFMAALVTLAGLIVDQNAEPPGQLPGRWVLAVAGILLAGGVLIAIIELIKRRSLRGSRGLLALLCGVLVAASAFTVPFTAAYFAPIPPTPVALAAAVETTPNAPGDAAQLAIQAAFRAFFSLVAEQTGMDNEAILERLRAGDTFKQILEANGGDVDTVVALVVENIRPEIELATAAGQINRLQSALILANLELLVRRGLDSVIFPEDVEELATIMSTPVTRVPTATPAPPTFTPTATATPTLTRTPRATNSPTPTRQPFSTTTPTPTATLGAPCLALVNFNLNVRSLPDSDESEVVTVIPFGTTVTVFGRNEDRSWWFVQYEGEAGWIDGQYVTASVDCTNVAVRDVR